MNAENGTEKKFMRFLALDIGNVCIKLNYERLLSQLGMTPDFFASAPIKKLVQRYEFGRCSDDDFFRELGQLPELRKYDDAVLRFGYRALLDNPLPGMPELLRELPDHGILPVFFSDISVFHLNACRDIIPEMQRYPGIYSFDTHAYKPDPAMFAQFESIYGVPVFYTDDRSELIAAARQRNWPAEVFHSASELLRQLGINK